MRGTTWVMIAPCWTSWWPSRPSPRSLHRYCRGLDRMDREMCRVGVAPRWHRRLRAHVPGHRHRVPRLGVARPRRLRPSLAHGVERTDRGRRRRRYRDQRVLRRGVAAHAPQDGRRARHDRSRPLRRPLVAPRDGPGPSTTATTSTTCSACTRARRQRSPMAAPRPGAATAPTPRSCCSPDRCSAERRGRRRIGLVEHAARREQLGEGHAVAAAGAARTRPWPGRRRGGRSRR